MYGTITKLSLPASDFALVSVELPWSPLSYIQHTS
jgi:hypothetical protein